MGCWFSGLRKRRRESGWTAEGGCPHMNSIRGVRTVMPSRRVRAEWRSSRVIIREFVQLCLRHRVSLIACFPPLEVAGYFRGSLRDHIAGSREFPAESKESGTVGVLLWLLNHLLPFATFPQRTPQ